jgi:hypothetical protein
VGRPDELSCYDDRVRRAFFASIVLVLGCSSSESVTAPLVDGSVGDGSMTAPDATSDGASDAGATSDAADAEAHDPGCLPRMVRIGAFCVDKYEAYVVELDGNGKEVAHSPYMVMPDAGVVVRAKVAAGVVPQGYISQIQATAACVAAGKRLCAATEFALACRGSDAGNDYPYGGTTHIAGDCNEGKGSSMPKFFGNNPQLWTYADFNDPRLNDWDGGLATTGTYTKCVSPYGVYDCVGNLHEWGSDRADVNGHGRFRGGFYGDAEINGKGCLYVTSAHELAYHDYSTGFRCCMDAMP